MFKNKKQRGVSLYLVILISTLILAIGLEISALLVTQVKMAREIGYSVVAFYAADTGIEYVLYLDKICRQSGCPIPPCTPGCQGLSLHYDSGDISLNEAEYRVEMPIYSLFKSKGKFRGVNRAIEVNRLNYKIVFAADVENGNLGGIDGADLICNTQASAAGLPGEYKAWITGTDPSNTPASRFNKADIPYGRTDGIIIANNWDDLVDGTLLAPINVDENGNPVPDPPSYAFTNTTDAGEHGGGPSCGNWDLTVGLGRKGIISATNSDWTYTGPPHAPCGSNQYIYCFQQ